MKAAYTKTYKVSATFNAPLGFVYSWCTDFRSDDLGMIGLKNARNLHEKTDRRVIWTVEGKKLESGTDPVRVVWLRPPSSWHLETCGDGSEVGDYKLTSLGKNRTRLDMVFTETYWNKKNVPSKKELKAEAADHWEKYGKYLEQDYKKSQHS
jgi:hypothetical protein